MRQRHLPILLALASACAGSRLAASAPAGEGSVPAPVHAIGPPAPAASAPSGSSPLVRGMTQDDVRRALGTPTRVESVESVAAPGARYQRWLYPGREIVFLDGKLVDAVPW